MMHLRSPLVSVFRENHRHYILILSRRQEKNQEIAPAAATKKGLKNHNFCCLMDGACEKQFPRVLIDGVFEH
jgi:hypothetical protein